MAKDTLAQTLGTLPDKRSQVALIKAFNAFRGVTVLQSVTNLGLADMGSTIYLDNSAGFTTTLPLPMLGGNLTVVVRTAPSSGNYTIVTANAATILKGAQTPVDGNAGNTSTAATTVNIVSGQAVPGDKIQFFSDGISWFADVISKVVAGVTFS